jgi:transposase InsO family protein
MCRVLLVSKAGFYAWCKRSKSERDIRDEALRRHIVAFHEASKKRYGSRPIVADLREIGEPCGRKRVVRIMRAAGLRGKQRKAFRVTTNSNHRKPIAANVLDRKFSPAEIASPNRVWAGDITYIRTREGWLYLAVLLDLFSRRVIGWAMSHSMESKLVLDALQMAVDRGRSTDGVLSHSDRGVQYADAAVSRFHERHGMKQSMSRKGNCWDNACVESFFSSLKRELDDRVYATREEARTTLFEYIEIWYNRQRRHSSLGYISPERFERDQAA